jgi:hypothetical protein
LRPHPESGAKPLKGRHKTRGEIRVIKAFHALSFVTKSGKFHYTNGDEKYGTPAMYVDIYLCIRHVKVVAAIRRGGTNNLIHSFVGFPEPVAR